MHIIIIIIIIIVVIRMLYVKFDEQFDEILYDGWLKRFKIYFKPNRVFIVLPCFNVDFTVHRMCRLRRDVLFSVLKLF